MTTTPASDPEITPRRGDPTVAKTIRRDYLFETGWRIQIGHARELKKKRRKIFYQQIYSNVYEIKKTRSRLQVPAVNFKGSQRVL